MSLNSVLMVIKYTPHVAGQAMFGYWYLNFWSLFLLNMHIWDEDFSGRNRDEKYGIRALKIMRKSNYLFYSKQIVLFCDFYIRIR